MEHEILSSIIVILQLFAIKTEKKQNLVCK